MPHSNKKQTRSSRASRALETPLGTIITVSAIILLTEMLIMYVFSAVFPPSVRFGSTESALNILDAAILTVAVSPALYYLIFRRIQTDAEKLTKITTSAQDAIIVMDNNGCVSFWNEAAERTFGYNAHEAMNKPMHNLIAPTKSLNAFEANFQHFRTTGEGPIVGTVREVIAKRKSGEQFYAELSVSPLLIGRGWHAVGIVRDISLRKQREEAIKERDEALAQANQWLEHEKVKDEAIMESLGEGLIATDKTGSIISINRAAEIMTGWEKKDILNKKVLEALPAVDEKGNLVPPEKRPAFIALSTGFSSASENLNLVVKNDGTIPVAATATPIKIKDETIGAVLIFHDITKEQELEITRRDLLSLASHQLRTPLSGTKWLIETLRSGIIGELNEKQKEYLEQIYKINEKMTGLVGDMLGVLRLEGDMQVAIKEQISPKILCENVFETLGSAAKSKNITLHLDAEETKTIETDPLLLQQTLESLLSNAINYSPTDSDIFISIKTNSAETIFAVKDSGIGIPLDEQRQIFQRFYRASNAKTFDTKGTGLGLYIASILAKKIGARISFESDIGKGSTFYVHVPIINHEVLPENTTRV